MCVCMRFYHDKIWLNEQQQQKRKEFSQKEFKKTLYRIFTFSIFLSRIYNFPSHMCVIINKEFICKQKNKNDIY